MNSVAEKKGIPKPVVALGLLTAVAVVSLVLFQSSRLSRQQLNPSGSATAESQTREKFVEAMQAGKNYLDQRQAEQAVESFQQAVAIHPGDLDASLNLANALLAFGRPQEAANAAAAAIAVNRHSAAGHYLLGCSQLRLGRFEEASKSLQTAKNLNRTVNAVSFQLGRAHQGLGQFEAAAAQFREVIQYDSEHGAAHYNLSQALIRLGDEDGAQQALAKHQEISQRQGAAVADPTVFERCVHTEARVPFPLEQPDSAGISMQFVEATDAILGDLAEQFEGPAGVLDVGHDGKLDLFARRKDGGFQILRRRQNTFAPEGFPQPGIPGSSYAKCLVGDLQHKTSLTEGRQEDVILLSNQGIQIFHVSTNGALFDASRFAQIADVSLADAVLMDFELTGKLDLVGLSLTNRSLVYLRNQGNASFADWTSDAGLPSTLEGVRQMTLEDWDGDDLLDFCLLRPGESPRLWLRQRGLGWAKSDALDNLPPARFVAFGDLNNDLRADIVALRDNGLAIQFQGGQKPATIQADTADLRKILLLDYDNDGWLDVLAFGGASLRSWRNRGLEGFAETTHSVGVDRIDWNSSDPSQAGFLAVKPADLDGDCDSDLLLTLADQSLRVLRNDGGNQNRQLKLRLEGNRSNPSALGVKIEIASGGLRMMRTVHELPIEIGLGKRQKVDALRPHWSDLVTTTDLALGECATETLIELELPTGSCPYLYVWDGGRFQFVTDFLGASPLGLPAAEGKLVIADTDEFVRLGNESDVRLLGSEYVLQVTEELREVLYLDQAMLCVIDHPEGVEAIPTNRLMPGPPFPKAELMAVHTPYPLRRAVRSDGLNVKESLLCLDGKMASPARLRAPQLRGLAEPHHFDLDFGPIDVNRPLVLVLDGWLRFGGGMANMSAARYPGLPFPFPVLSVELMDGTWKTLDLSVGAPAGKIKSMAVNLEGQLPAGTQKLRLSAAFEIHWDRIALMEKYKGKDVVRHFLKPSQSNLHWRGFSEYQNLPWDLPLSPDYNRVNASAPWLLMPSGWCTRYGEVNALLSAKDNQLVILNGGDELTLRFDGNSLPPKSGEQQRSFYLFVSGWDKDADPHVVKGRTVEPIPWHGMDGQKYGRQLRPQTLNDEWQKKYNTRWVGEFALRPLAKNREKRDFSQRKNSPIPATQRPKK